MASSKKLEMIYYNGQPDGIRSIRRHLSTMTTYVIPRPLLSDAKKISGINRPGIYYLINENDENRIAQIYIGQTRNGISRLDDHNRQKDFWNKAIMFLSDSKTFSLDIISGLEEYAIVKAHESKRYSVENSVKPQYEIDEYDLPIIMDKPTNLERYNRQRADLLEKGSISVVDGKYILHATIEFNTPSGASDFVLGGSTNGWTEWKTKAGKTLDEAFRKKG